MSRLQELAAGGNALASLPEDLGALTALTALALHGNALGTVPASVRQLTSLKALWLQGNALRFLPSLPLPVCGCFTSGGLTTIHQALEELSVADNALTELPSLGGATSLHSLWAYGNNLKALPATVVSLPSLRRLWVEDNAALSHADASSVLATRGEGEIALVVGMDATDDSHAGNVPGVTILPSLRRTGGPGYFKLATGPLPHAGATFTSTDGRPCARTLVVAFGSAPGTPNWGGLLSRVYAAAEEDAGDSTEPIDAAQFDVLYVVDPCRAWYGGGDDGWGEYYARLERCLEGYARVVMLGDSMGGTAALLASPLATHVLAFCPQVHDGVFLPEGGHACIIRKVQALRTPTTRWTWPAPPSAPASLKPGSTR